MGHFGFSYVGLVYLLMLFIPNGIWTKYQPDGYAQLQGKENKALRFFEKAGQVLVTCCALFFSDFNPVGVSPWSLWLFASLGCMILYEACWIRYFKRGHTLRDMYGPFLGIPVPLAALPVLGFLLLGIYGRVVWMAASAILLGIGHVGIHLQHLGRIEGR